MTVRERQGVSHSVRLCPVRGNGHGWSGGRGTRPPRNPWKTCSLDSCPGRGKGTVIRQIRSNCETTVPLPLPGQYTRLTQPFHGFRDIGRCPPPLHPWLQSVAPAGAVSGHFGPRLVAVFLTRKRTIPKSAPSSLQFGKLLLTISSGQNLKKAPSG